MCLYRNFHFFPSQYIQLHIAPHGSRTTYKQPLHRIVTNTVTTSNIPLTVFLPTLMATATHRLLFTLVDQVDRISRLQLQQSLQIFQMRMSPYSSCDWARYPHQIRHLRMMRRRMMQEVALRIKAMKSEAIPPNFLSYLLQWRNTRSSAILGIRRDISR